MMCSHVDYEHLRSKVSRLETENFCLEQELRRTLCIQTSVPVFQYCRDLDERERTLKFLKSAIRPLEDWKKSLEAN